MVLPFEAKGTMYEGRTENIEFVKVSDTILVERDPKNKFNPQNFRLFTEQGKDVGNVPEDICSYLASPYDRGEIKIYAKASYVEPLSKRGPRCRKGILFVQYYILRFRDDVLDVREQFPLPLESTLEIVSKYKGFRHPGNRYGELVPFTTDFLVDLVDGRQEAYSVKYSLDDLMKHENQIKNLYVQKEYWNSIGVELKQVFTVHMNNALYQNISRMVYYYDLDTVRCTLDLYRHMVARKLIRIDLESKVITPDNLYRMAQQHLSGYDVEAVKEELRLKYLYEKTM